MVRMIVTLPECDKQWIMQAGRRKGCSSAEIVRQAVVRLRECERDDPSGLSRAISSCAGRWKTLKKDGQELVDSWRSEWDDTP